MKKCNRDVSPGETIYMGLDVHRKSWHLTVRTRDEEIQKMSLPPHWDTLQKVIERYGPRRTEVAYEAGYFGYGLHDLITAQGARCIALHRDTTFSVAAGTGQPR